MSLWRCYQIPLTTVWLLSQLWKAYLAERREAVRGLPVTHRDVAALNNTYERALVTMHKMPRVWQDYLEFLVGQRLVTRARRTFDSALRALPITQHDRLWPQYLVRVTSGQCLLLRPCAFISGEAHWMYPRGFAIFWSCLGLISSKNSPSNSAGR